MKKHSDPTWVRQGLADGSDTEFIITHNIIDGEHYDIYINSVNTKGARTKSPTSAPTRRSFRQMPQVGGEVQKCGSLSTQAPFRPQTDRLTVSKALAM
jgi:hypothetical protein